MAENHRYLIRGLVEKSKSESGERWGFDHSRHSFGDSLETEEFHLRDVQRNSYVRGAIVMAGSILPTDLSSRHDVGRPCSRASGLHDASRKRKTEGVQRGYIAHVTQMKLK